ncbi:MAG: MerR family transcriptional regulator [Sphingomonadaceae bacterium]
MAQFFDGKEHGALRTIGEVADALGIKQHVLRYWEQQFPMLQPLKRSGGRRYYRTEDVALVELIDRLVNREGYTLKGAKKALAQKGMTSEIEREQAVADTAVDHVSADPGNASPPNQEPLPLVAELPDNGGLEAFFGRPAAEALPPELPDTGSAAPEPAAGAGDYVVSQELVRQLKSIRARLADALAA